MTYTHPLRSEFMKKEMDCLGLIVGRDGLRVNPDKIEVLETWPKPESLTDLRSFLGLLQFFRRFIPKFSEVAAPLTDLSKNDIGIGKWNETCNQAFESLKDAITQEPILVDRIE